MNDTETRHIATLEDAIDLLELISVENLSLHAQRPDIFLGAGGEEISAVQDLKTAFRVVENGVDYRLQVNVAFEGDGIGPGSGTIEAEVMGAFRAPVIVEFEPEVVEAFEQMVARTNLYPYARAAVADLAQKIGIGGLHLPLLKRDAGDTDLDARAQSHEPLPAGEHRVQDESAEYGA